MATGSDDATVNIWDISENKVIHTLEGHEGKFL